MQEPAPEALQAGRDADARLPPPVTHCSERTLEQPWKPTGPRPGMPANRPRFSGNSKLGPSDLPKHEPHAAVAVGLLARARSRAGVRLARILAVAVVLSAAMGIWQHVYANYDAGPLDFHYTDTWDSLPEATLWWLALTKSVGPSP